jgi:muramoyltetrapeptide carboxypeptidase
MQVIKPAALRKGDLVGLITPASTPDELNRIENSVKYFEGLGYSVIVGKNVGKYRGYLAGSDQERLDDLHSMFSNKNVKAIFCLRGGYGAFRLLDKINYRLIKSNPKIFVGYSEITALQNAIFSKTGLITFAGPMPAVDFVGEISQFTEEFFWNLITSKKKIGKIKYPEDPTPQVLKKGVVSGQISGGNLAVITALCGTKFMPDMRNKILMIEDINEKPYRVDRMLNQLRLNGLFSKIKGIILGRFVDCYEDDANKKTLTLGEVIDDYICPLKIPSIYVFPHGHIKDFVTIPLGLKIKLDADKKSVEFLESAVS